VTIHGTCSTCHNTPNVGGHSVIRMMDIGTANEPNCNPVLPIITVQNKTTMETRRVCDLGRGQGSGVWTEIASFRVPPLRGLAARAPYFHNGSAKNIKQAIRYHEERFNIDQPPEEGASPLTELAALENRDVLLTLAIGAIGFGGLFSINPRPFVLGNMIYLKNYTATADPEAIAHECTHVWQNQHVGSCYTAEALASQFWGVGYEWEKEADATLDWEDFGREAQGQSVQYMYTNGGSISGSTGNGAIFSEPDPTLRVFNYNGTDRVVMANDAISAIRHAPWRISALFD